MNDDREEVYRRLAEEGFTDKQIGEPRRITSREETAVEGLRRRLAALRLEVPGEIVDDIEDYAEMVIMERAAGWSHARDMEAIVFANELNGAPKQPDDEGCDGDVTYPDGCPDCGWPNGTEEQPLSGEGKINA